MVKITGVEKHSPLKRKVKAGMQLVSVNGNEIHDFLDYNFYIAEEKLELVFKKENRFKTIRLKKQPYDDIGLEFENYIMDKERSCANQCIFCFIDQLPPGMRDTLYFKDDDARLSFLFGNYLTLTNISQREIDRIIKMHISPINVSVHTMNEQLRVEMMGNKRAGKVLSYLDDLKRGGIKMNAQLVLCPGINDGEELRYSLDKLEKYYPELQSVAVVPVGLTDYREGLYDLKPYTRESAENVLQIIDEYEQRFLEQYGTKLVFAADEFYLKAGRKIPDAAFYEDFEQLENGVGMWAMMKDEFIHALESVSPSNRSVTLTLAAGEAAAPLFQELVDLLHEKCYNISVNVVAVKNRFFGSKITVSGLLTGSDLLKAFEANPPEDTLLIPKAMLKNDENIFLDDITLEQLAQRLNTRVIPIANDGYELLEALLGESR
ncbi:MAG: DUF512 domain-containing protein [Clostridia bacterium]|nr:DUF512 domain-containing protein [Clostridia bacterium]